MKRQPTEWKKIFANDMTKRGLTSKIYKYLIQANIKKKQSSQKIDKSKQTFLQKRHTDVLWTHEKMLILANHQGNENQNQIEISPHTSQNDYHQKEHK